MPQEITNLISTTITPDLIRIMRAVVRGARRVGDIADTAKVPESTAYYALRALIGARLVSLSGYHYAPTAAGLGVLRRRTEGRRRAVRASQAPTMVDRLLASPRIVGAS